jgi:GR25 family glycosyltransferase involved in LPS biosynthesis
MIIKYYLIHCLEHIERIIHIKKIIKYLGYPIQIVEGIYTKSIDLNKETQLDFMKKFDSNIEFKNTFTFKLSGQIGCYLSHHLLIKKLLQQEHHNYSVIFEDDVKWNITDLHSSIINVINSLNLEDWDIVFLGNLTNNHGKVFKNNIYYLDPRIPCFGTHSLLINNNKLDKIYRHNCLVRHEIDTHYKILIDCNKLNGFVIYPPLCFQNNNLKSNIKIFN